MRPHDIVQYCLIFAALMMVFIFSSGNKAEARPVWVIDYNDMIKSAKKDFRHETPEITNLNASIFLSYVRDEVAALSAMEPRAIIIDRDSVILGFDHDITQRVYDNARTKAKSNLGSDGIIKGGL